MTDSHEHHWVEPDHAVGVDHCGICSVPQHHEHHVHEKRPVSDCPACLSAATDFLSAPDPEGLPSVDLERLAEAWWTGIQHRNGLTQEQALARWNDTDRDTQHMRGVYLDVAKHALAALSPVEPIASVSHVWTAEEVEEGWIDPPPTDKGEPE